MKLDYKKLSSSLRWNKILMDENVASKLRNFIKTKLNTQNLLIFHQLTTLFKLSRLSKTTFSYINRFFTSVAESKNFLELDFIHVLKILRSSEILTTSELEVFDSANKWLNYNIKERSKYAKKLLLTVRFPLLSDSTLKYIQDRSSSFSKIEECCTLLHKSLERKGVLFQNSSSMCYKARYCNQEMFEIMLCGGEDNKSYIVRTVKKFDLNNFKSIEYFPPMTEKRSFSEAVCVNGEVYVFGGHDASYNSINSVEKYSPSTKTWKKVARMNRQDFCACAFMDSVFVIGGSDNKTTTDSCLQFNTKDNSWKEVARMTNRRENAASAVFEERIVVSGGSDINFYYLNSVESYDVAADNWAPMPSMIEERVGHSSVVVKNKLFVIGGAKLVANRGAHTYEVFDSISNKFIILEPRFWLGYNRALSIGSKIYILLNNKSFIVSYDIDKDDWSVEASEATKNIKFFSCVKLPVY